MEAGVSKKEPKATDGKNGGDDLSMEEILQSIRRIIADDDNEGKKSVSDNKNGKGKAKDTDEVPGSDMLELTDMLKEDGTVVDLKKETASAKASLSDPQPASFDILKQIDQALEEEKFPEAPKEDVVETVHEAPPPVAAEAPVAPAPQPAATAAPVEPISNESLLSDAAAAATAEAFSRLKAVEQPAAPAPASGVAFRSGATMEDLVADMLRPMLKAWLNENLPQIVERIVEREVKKLTR